jgi:hypothetical protein
MFSNSKSFIVSYLGMWSILTYFLHMLWIRGPTLFFCGGYINVLAPLTEKTNFQQWITCTLAEYQSPENCTGLFLDSQFCCICMLMPVMHHFGYCKLCAMFWYSFPRIFWLFWPPYISLWSLRQLFKFFPQILKQQSKKQSENNCIEYVDQCGGHYHLHNKSYNSWMWDLFRF